jgi:hypothetical protein
MNNLLNSYDDKFYIFDSKPKMKMLIIRKNNYIDDYYLNDLEYIITKSLLNNLYLDRRTVEKNIAKKLKKTNKFTKDEIKTFLKKLRYIDKKKLYEKKVKKKIISNVFELNQSGGGLLWAINKLLSSQIDNSTFFSILYNIYNTIIVLVDVILDVSISFPRFLLFGLEESKNLLVITNLVFAVLNLDYLGIGAALLAFIPNFGDIISSVGGISIHIYRLISYLISDNEKSESSESVNYKEQPTAIDKVIEEDQKNLKMFDVNDDEINDKKPIYNFDKGYKPKFVFTTPKRMILPQGNDYNKVFYNQIKDL